MESLIASTLPINLDVLLNCVKKSLQNEEAILLGWEINSVATRTKNFTTRGVYRVHGTARVKNNDLPWSMIVKIIKPESEEKNDPKHFNFWKREALVFQSGLLDDLPDAIQIPSCYMVEEKSETEIWLWMEEVKEDNSRIFSLEEFSFIAKQIGLFQGALVSEKYPLPQEEWISENWLSSWVGGCDQYAPNISEFYPKIKKPTPMIESIMKAYLSLRKNEEKYLHHLNYLPRVISHNDLSQQNLYISDNGPMLILIDWQYLSVSGLGEDVGKMFAVAMSQEDIPLNKAWEYEERLFKSYVDGLRQAGWNGNPLYARYGFCLAVAFRSAWEVPKLIKLLAQDSPNELADQIEEYTQIVSVQLELAEEASTILEHLK